MNEIIKINYETEQPTVSARDLHEALEVKERFSVWTDRLLNYFGSDEMTSVGIPTEVQNNGGVQIRELTDYIVSIDTAKHICLMSRTEKGKQCRQYLIDLEKAWNTPELVMARGLKAAQAMIEQKDTVIKEQKQIIEKQRPKVIFADAVSTSHTSILIGDLAKLIRQNGVEIGQKRLFAWMRENGYLIKRKGEDWNMPTQRAMEMKLLEVKESTVNNPDGSVRINKTTKVTGKGQQYFINKFLGVEQTGQLKFV